VLVRLEPGESPTIRIITIEGGQMHFLPLNKEYRVVVPEHPEILGVVPKIELVTQRIGPKA
jgi:SOS-response transcriptional repressor LexA